jgi:hypothetical protein
MPLNLFDKKYTLLKKIMVTKKSTLKWDLEHYALSDVCIVFFKFKTEKSKMDKNKCPFSKNPKYFWKKRFTSFTSASAIPILPRGGL